MTSTAEIRNRTCVVSLAGEFDRANVGELRSKIEWCLKSASSVLFDLGEVTFINGAVMSLLLEVAEQLGEEGWLGVARPLKSMERLFSVAGLSAFPNFRIYATLEEALEAVDRG